MSYKMSKPVILTGIRSNDEPTLGNYLGAFLPMAHLAHEKAGEYQLNMFVPDLHSFTTPIDHSKLFTNTLRNLKLFVAAGLPIDNPDVYIYRQSYIPAHSELAWILSCFTGFGEASRMVEFKDKSTRLGDGQVSVGLFNYPILMAADILLYGALWVPVGEDQRQHLELTRDLANRLNNKFGELFVVPEDITKQQQFVNRDAAPRIRSLRNPEKKMSKSVSDPAGTILLSDSPDEAAKKVLSATTDSEGSIHFDFEKQAGVTNLLQILALLTNKNQSDVTAEWEGKSSYGELKKTVADAVSGFLSDFQARLVNVDEAQLMTKLEADENQMNEVANTTLLKVQKAIGLR
jgi:tryptophanyl-tRNA synthetase